MTAINKAKILIIATHGFEQAELEVPRDKLREAGAKVDVATPDGNEIRGWNKKDWGNTAPADLKIANARESDYDALVIPGGVLNPDKLRINDDAMKIVRDFLNSGKIVAAVCHGPWLLVQADALKGRNATSYKSIREDVENAGATTEVLSVKDGSGNSIRGWKFTDWGDSVRVDKNVAKANVDDYDALILPGGQINPDKLRMEKSAVEFVKNFVTSGKPVAAICHGPWMLVEAGVVKGKSMTSWPSIHTDLINAGAKWVDKDVVEDGNLITSRKPDDIPAFSKKVIEATAKGARLAKAS